MIEYAYKKEHPASLPPNVFRLGKSIPHSSFIELTLKHRLMAVEEGIAAKSEGS